MIFTVDSIHFMASKKKIEFLRQAEQNKDENAVPPVKLHVRNKVEFCDTCFSEFSSIQVPNNNLNLIEYFAFVITGRQ
jgi:hypothetical protein